MHGLSEEAAGVKMDTLEVSDQTHLPSLSFALRPASSSEMKGSCFGGKGTTPPTSPTIWKTRKEEISRHILAEGGIRFKLQSVNS